MIYLVNEKTFLNITDIFYSYYFSIFISEIVLLSKKIQWRRLGKESGIKFKYYHREMKKL